MVLDFGTRRLATSYDFLESPGYFCMLTLDSPTDKTNIICEGDAKSLESGELQNTSIAGDT